MRREATRKKLRELMKEVLHVSHIDGDCQMGDVETWDSLKHLDLIARIEDEFGIAIEFEDFIEMISLEKIVDVISRYLEQN